MGRDKARAPCQMPRQFLTSCPNASVLAHCKDSNGAASRDVSRHRQGKGPRASVGRDRQGKGRSGPWQ